jgi:acetylornithine deacetylase/succinyl-diaminopimelate desuccinylase-like protein
MQEQKEQLKKLENWFVQNEQKIFIDFFRFLAFPSVSARKESLPDLKNCAEFLKKLYEHIGYHVRVIETNFAPCLIIEKLVDPSFPTVLFYHHYDVQPEDPLDLWTSLPFEPVIQDNAVYARGAQDNKGQCFYTYTALKALHDLGIETQVNIKILIEGEEEVGSIHLKDVLKKHADLLKADYLYIVDSGMKSLESPVIGIGARGVLSYELTVTSQSTDLHSGEHGGLAFSATRAIVELLAKCFDQDGKVVVDDFYKEVKPLHLDPQIFDVKFDDKEYSKTFGVKAFSNLPGKSLVESNWVYPTLEINGIYGGYIEQGFKTVLPAKAHAKLSIRTVPNQNPEALSQSLEAFLKRNVRKGIDVELKVLSLGDFVMSSPDSTCVKVAKEAYSVVFGKPCLYSLCGGSIPITAKLAKAAQAEPCLIGTGLMDDNIHAPDEHFQIESFKKGFLTIACILDILKNYKR